MTLHHIFPPIILIVTLKRAQKSNWGEINDIFSPCVFIFTPLGHAIIVLLSQTLSWGGNMARGKSDHIFPAGHNLFFVTVSAYSNWGKIYDIFSPCVFIFSLLGHAINCSTFTGGKYSFPLCQCFYPWPCCMVLLYLPS